MRICLIWAMAQNRVIGRDGDLPWHLPADLKRFKKLTLGHPILMGRRTFESIGKPLPKRHNMVLTSHTDFAASATTAGVEVFTSLDDALASCRADFVESLFVIGGRAVYEATLPLATDLYLTAVHAEVDGDVRFPTIDWQPWRLIGEADHEADQRHPHAFTFRHYQRA